MLSIIAFCISAWSLGAYAEFDAFSGLEKVDFVKGVQQILSNVREMAHPQKDCKKASEPIDRCSRYTLNILDGRNSFPFVIARPVMKNPVYDSFSQILRDTSGEAPPFTGQEPELIPCNVFVEAETLDDIIDAIVSLGKKCPGCIKELNLLSHGSPGMLEMFQLRNWENPILEDEFKMKQLPEAFAPGANILIHGCEVGLGVPGERLMNGLGQKMLSRHGGTVRAHNQKAFVNLFANDPRHITFSFGEISVYHQPAGGLPGKFWREKPGAVFSSAGD